MNREKEKWFKRKRRQLRVRKKIFGTPERPRLCIYRSLKHFYAQAIDDTTGQTLCALSTLSKELKAPENKGNTKAAEILGEAFAKLALQKGIKKVVFDRRHYKFHGRVKAFADAARKGGLVF
jgi:large subunit ribosomal protein L18